jgi:c-di-GMP-related signal transduction protein
MERREPVAPAAREELREVVVARQPIVDRDREVVGFELLYRPCRTSPDVVGGDRMTAEVVLGALTIGVEALVGDKVMYCNAERGVLVGETPITLPPERTVVEVLETVAIDEELVAGCRDLVARGYALALDDFQWGEGVESLLELASIVKVDMLATARPDVEALVARCRRHGVRLLAEKVETEADVAWAMALGFDLFQGYAIERPVIVRAETIAASALSHMQLAMTLLGEDLDFDEVEEILRREPGLVLQVLQLASLGAERGLRRQVRTLREALVLMGTRRIRQWVALTILGNQPGGGIDGLAVALVRARTCELLAPSVGSDDAGFAFTAGLLSALDLLLGVPIEELAATLQLDDALKRAAFEREGVTGRLVDRVARHQDSLARGTGGEPDGPGEPGEPAPAELLAAESEAFAWAMPYLSSLGSPAGQDASAPVPG